MEEQPQQIEELQAAVEAIAQMLQGLAARVDWLEQSASQMPTSPTLPTFDDA